MWIQFDGILNARDLGGIPAADGRRVKAGRLLRGAGLSSASDADIERLRRDYRLRHILFQHENPPCFVLRYDQQKWPVERNVQP